MNYYKCGTPDNSKVDWESEGVLGAKNLLPYPYYETTKTTHDVTFTDNGDGTIHINGTASAQIFYVLFQRTNNPLVLNPGNYILSLDASLVSNNIWLQLLDISGTEITRLYGDTISQEFTIEETTNCGLIFIIGNGVAVTNLMTKPMIRPAVVKNADYVPFALTNKAITNRIDCTQTTAGTYVLKATVNANKKVTYSWVAE